MYFLRSVLLSVLGVLLLLVLSCSGTSPTTPSVNTAQGDGDIWSPSDPFPVDPVPEDPIPYPWWDCQRFFTYQGSISFWEEGGPYTIPLIVFGGIRIRDEDCSANVSDVMVRWTVKDHPNW